MTDSEQIRAILNNFGKIVSSKPNGEGPAYAYKEAKAQLTALLREARVDELKRYQEEAYQLGFVSVVEDRIAELTANTTEEADSV